MTIETTEQKEQYSSGAVRNERQGKGRFDLISVIAERRLANWYEAGCQVYGDRNWEKGMPHSRFVDSTKRHINAYLTVKQLEREGFLQQDVEEVCASMGINPLEDHLAAAVWNLMSIMHLELTHPEMDDLGRPLMEPVMTEESVPCCTDPSPECCPSKWYDRFLK